MKKNVLDLVVDELHRRRGLVKGVLSKQFKNTNPYRQEPVSDEERIRRYWSDIVPYEAELRAQGIDVDGIHANMRELINRRMQNA